MALEAGLLSAAGAFVLSGLAVCAKRYTGAKYVHCRCIMDDASCMCGFTTDESEIQTKLEERKKTMEDEVKKELDHQQALHEKDVALIEQRYESAYDEMKRDLIEKNQQLRGLQEMLQVIQSDFRRVSTAHHPTSPLPPMHNKPPPPRVQMHDLGGGSKKKLYLGRMTRSRSSSAKAPRTPTVPALIMSPRKKT